jgi:hypothetical protein
MVRRVRRKRDVMFLIAAALIIAFIWGAFEISGDDEVVEPNPDSDGDGLLDEWEMTHFGDLDEDADDDPDGDGLSNLEEYEAGSDPNVAPPPPPPENLTFTAYARNWDNGSWFDVTLSVDGAAVFNVNLTPSTGSTASIMGSDGITYLEGTYTFSAIVVNGTTNRTESKELVLEKMFDNSTQKDKVPYLYVDVTSTDIYIFFATEKASEAACGGS